MKFAMGADVLSTLGQKTSTESDDMGQLVRNLKDAAEPLEGTFNGTAKSSFNSFKSRTDDIAATLNSTLAGITGSIDGQNRSFTTAANEGGEIHRAAENKAEFAGADSSRYAPPAQA